MEHRATEGFWRAYQALPREIQNRADKQFSLLKRNPQHPSIQFKKVGASSSQEMWSARVTLNYRALSLKRADAYLWFWIGDHAGYEALIS
ncbi:MAG: type II toxin-antitoxin system RelE family toxin [Candidatus Acidiferrum sp.]